MGQGGMHGVGKSGDDLAKQYNSSILLDGGIKEVAVFIFGCRVPICSTNRPLLLTHFYLLHTFYGETARKRSGPGDVDRA